MLVDWKMQIIRIVFFVGIIVFLYFVFWLMFKVWLKLLFDMVQEQVEDVFDYGFDGIIVYVGQEGQFLVFYVVGWYDFENKIFVYLEVLFKIVSISKFYMVVVIVKLVYDGYLFLDKIFVDYFFELAG